MYLSCPPKTSLMTGLHLLVVYSFHVCLPIPFRPRKCYTQVNQYTISYTLSKAYKMLL